MNPSDSESLVEGNELQWLPVLVPVLEDLFPDFFIVIDQLVWSEAARGRESGDSQGHADV